MRALSLMACLYGLTFLVALYPRLSQAGNALPSCAVDYVAYGQGKLTPAVVTGATNSHLTLHQRHPLNDTVTYDQDATPDKAYLISGDNVDIAATCGGYAYVRYRSHKSMSSGWVDNSRIQITGKPYEQPTIDVATICRAATEAIDGHQWTRSLPLRRIDPVVATKNHLNEYGSRATSLARILVDGRVLTVVLIEDGGTEESNYIDVWSDDMSEHLSQHDRPSTDPISNLSDGPNEGLVEVLGLPMIYQYVLRGEDKSYLSSIDKDGNVKTVCEGGSKALSKPLIVFSSPNVTCESFIDGGAKDVPMSRPYAGETLFVSHPPSGLNPEARLGPDVFQDRQTAVTVTYKLLETGEADLDNSGHRRRIGLVSYEAMSGAGDGWNGFHAAPVFLDPQGHADPTTPENKAIFDGIVTIGNNDDGVPIGLTYAKAVRAAGKTYIEVSQDTESSPVYQTWRVGGSGAKKVCQFQSGRYEFDPVSP